MFSRCGLVAGAAGNAALQARPLLLKVTDLLHCWQIDPTWLPGWQSLEAWPGRVNF
jgi:hypothetical protein